MPVSLQEVFMRQMMSDILRKQQSAPGKYFHSPLSEIFSENYPFDPLSTNPPTKLNRPVTELPREQVIPRGRGPL